MVEQTEVGTDPDWYDKPFGDLTFDQRRLVHEKVAANPWLIAEMAWRANQGDMEASELFVATGATVVVYPSGNEIIIIVNGQRLQ